ncbi:MAG: hypothetical protein IJE03_01885, partial [Ruminiclostridium sp.]|nr:hypothetical protein [Ruminiclostridium sp.]
KDIRRRPKISPVRIVVLEVWYYTHICQHCNTEGTEAPATKATIEATFLPGSFTVPEPFYTCLDLIDQSLF